MTHFSLYFRQSSTLYWIRFPNPEVKRMYKMLMIAALVAVPIFHAHAEERIRGIPYDVHRGQGNYAYSIQGQPRQFVIPMVSFGSVIQAERVDQFAITAQPFSFMTDRTPVSYHGGAVGDNARDFDDDSVFATSAVRK